MTRALPDPREPRARRRGPRRWLPTFLGVFAVLLAARAALPFGVRAYVNRVLDRDGESGYRGRVGKLDLNLWRGAYEIEDLVIERVGREGREPFLAAQRLDLSVRWAALLSGRVVGEATLQRPVLTFVAGGGAQPSQTGAGPSWAARLDALFPFEIERFVARDGEVRFEELGTDPPIDLYVADVFLEAHGLTNAPGADPGPLPAEVEAAGRPFGTAEIEARMRFDPLADRPRFELDAAARAVELAELNDLLRSFGGFDAEAGTVDLYAEFAVADGGVEGYVKSLFDGVRIASLGEIDGPEDALEAFWEGLVELGAELLENQPEGRVAAYIPLTGRSGDLGSDLVTIVASLLRNAFVAAMRPAIEESIELSDLRVARAEPARDGGAGRAEDPRAGGRP